MGCLLYKDGLHRSPYAHLLDNSLWADICQVRSLRSFCHLYLRLAAQLASSILSEIGNARCCSSRLPLFSDIHPGRVLAARPLGGESAHGVRERGLRGAPLAAEHQGGDATATGRRLEHDG